MKLWYGLLALALASFPTFAQYELGDGTGLRRDYGRYGTENVPQVTQGAQLQALRLRNAIVTGNVAGGRSFRGDVGYTAPYEFRGELGSNDLFSFRRDSTFSGLGGVGARGTEALQHQFMATTGTAPSNVMLGPIVQRSQTGTPAGQFVGRPGGERLRSVEPINERFAQETATGYQPRDPTGGFGGVDTSGTALMQDLRSTSTYISNRSFQPELLYAVRTQEGVQGLTASGLRGIRTETFESQSAEVDEEEPERPFSQEVARPDTAIDPNRPAAQPMLTPYDELVARIEQRDAELVAEREEADGQADPRPAWRQQLDELREQLRELEMEEALGEPIEDGDGEESVGDEAEEEEPALVRLDPETLRLISEAGGEVDSFIPSGGAESNLYARHIGIGQRYLASGRYFDAEERFTAALSVRPDDVTAQVGRTHAQIGAAAFLSAATNLRVLLTEHPEVGAVRYGQDVKPSPERLDEVLDLLRTNIRTEGRMSSESSLLMAYLGYQMQDDAVLREGLAAMERLMAGDPLVEYAERVWGGA